MSPLHTENLLSDGANVEVIWAKPEHSGSWPLLLFVHGHMENRLGARIHTNFMNSACRLNRWRVCIASVSQPGYGNSDGPPDYCGPKTQSAIANTIEFFRQKSFIDPNKIVLIGYSRGAICASNVAVKDKSLAAVVLGAGFYDFESYYKSAPLGIQHAIEKEVGLSSQAFEERSSLKHAELIQSPLLIMHGRLDERKGTSEAEEMSRRAPKAKAIIFSEFGHHIPFRIFYREVRKFLSQHIG